MLELLEILQVNAPPNAMGIVPATIGIEPINPFSGEVMCIEPPLPPEQPSDLPNISAKSLNSDPPEAK